MIAEFDAMVGEYMAAVKDTGLWENTVFIVTADHGDMNMEHQQFYKMVPYDAASSVPLVVSAPGVVSRSVRTPTSHLSLFPTILDIAKVPRSAWPAATAQPTAGQADRGRPRLAPHQAPPPTPP